VHGASFIGGQDPKTTSGRQSVLEMNSFPVAIIVEWLSMCLCGSRGPKLLKRGRLMSMAGGRIRLAHVAMDSYPYGHGTCCCCTQSRGLARGMCVPVCQNKKNNNQSGLGTKVLAFVGLLTVAGQTLCYNTSTTLRGCSYVDEASTMFSSLYEASQS